MNNAEIIQAAINKLEDLRRESTYSAVNEPWLLNRGDWTVGERATDGGQYATLTAHEDGRFPATQEPDGETVASLELVVVLHRTIIAQLAILRDALAMSQPFFGMVMQESVIEKELNLAKAILGSAT